MRLRRGEIEMEEYDLEYIKQICGMSEPKIKQIEKYYSKFCREEKIEVEKVKSDLYFQRKYDIEKGKKAEFNYAIFLIATKKSMISFENIERTKDPDQNKISRIDEIKIARLREEHQAKIAPNAAWIQHHIGDIQKMREKGLSWAEISEYVKKYFRKTISKSYLRDMYFELN